MAKKILFVITKSNWGGAQWYVHTLATHFRHADFDVAVVLGGTGEKDADTGILAERLQQVGIRTLFLQSFMRDISLLQEFRAFAELVRIFRKERPSVVHLNSSKAGGLGALAGRITGIPNIVFTSHGLAFDEDRSLLARVVIWALTWVTVLLTHSTIVISRDTYERARRLPFCKNKIHLVYNGIESTVLLDRFSARSHLAPHVPHDKRIWIGTIAEFTHNKALSSLVLAATLLKKNGYVFELCLIGTRGEEQPLVERMIEKEGLSEYVHILGFVPNAASYLKAFDIFALVSVKEGLPTALLEAAQAPCAVIGTCIAGITDIIDDTTGILVTPKNVREISDGLQLLICDETRRLELARALQDKVAKTFSLEQMVEKTTAVYNS